MPQKIKQVGEFKLGDWVTYYHPDVAMEIIALGGDGKSAHLRNKNGVMDGQPREKLSKYAPQVGGN